ncbi:MAG: hypothetical protein BMS9Abin05_1306 [Rhodothermia bacterium]|nr:MAG: hypothetical protein BMS9Abin05_1306 [Rhodothermia bacterium]
MHSRINSSFSLIAGIPFALFVLLSLSLFVGCRSESGKSNSSGPEPDPVASDAPEVESSATAIVTPFAEPRVVTYDEAEASYKNARYSDAVKLFTLYTEQKPENPWGQYMLGLSAFKVGAFEMSQSAFEASLALDPNHQKSLLNLARVFLSTDRASEALGAIEEAREIDLAIPDVYRLQGRALHALGQLTEAADAYREAIRIDNRDVWSMNNLALVLIDEGFHDLAIPPLARAVELNPDIAVFFNNLGMALEHTGQYRAAEAAYASALDVDATYGKALANLSRVEIVDQNANQSKVDLLAMAQDFVEEIDSWSDEAIAREIPIAIAGRDSSDVFTAQPDSSATQAQ